MRNQQKLGARSLADSAFETSKAEKSRFPSGSLAYLHQTVGNRGVARMFSNPSFLQRAPASVIQCARIGTTPIRPYGVNGKELWELTRNALLSSGMSPHGAKKKFMEIAKSDRTFNNVDQFTGEFVQLAKLEVDRVTQEKRTLPKEQRTKGWTRMLKLSRTAWTEEHKKAAQSGHDIRHVIRNATMRDALMREFQARMKEDQSGQKAKEAFSAISKAAGLTAQSTHPWEMMNDVYKAIYLNFGNLFAGAGAVNRVIGLTADDITSKGLALLSQNVPIDESEIERNFDEVALLISNKSDQTEAQAFTANKQHRLDDEGLERFIEGHEHFFDTISDYLIDAEDAFTGRTERGESVLASEIGHIFIEIGANFGFDIPLEGVGKEHMEVFIETEQFLASYNGSNTGGLAAVLAKFMQLANILSKQ